MICNVVMYKMSLNRACFFFAKMRDLKVGGVRYSIVYTILLKQLKVFNWLYMYFEIVTTLVSWNLIACFAVLRCNAICYDYYVTKSTIRNLIIVLWIFPFIVVGIMIHSVYPKPGMFEDMIDSELYFTNLKVNDGFKGDGVYQSAFRVS